MQRWWAAFGAVALIAAGALSARRQAFSLHNATVAPPTAVRVRVTPQAHVQYIEPDLDRVRVDAAFKGEPRIDVDVAFHHFRDRYGLVNVQFDEAELVELLREVSSIWMRGNIWLRFRLGDVMAPQTLPDDKADVYKWWVTGSKQRGSAAFKRDFERLAHGPGQVGEEVATRVVRQKAAQNGGHSLLNWVLGIGPRPRGATRALVHVYAVYFYRWYNGGHQNGRVFLRCGACGRNESLKLLDGAPVRCNGWRTRGDEQSMHRDEFVRVLAHELGHALGLGHPSGGVACQVAASEDEMLLMRQQRAVTVVGHNCSDHNPIARRSRRLRRSELRHARRRAAAMAEGQRELYERWPGLGSSATSPSEAELAQTVGDEAQSSL